MKNVQLDIHLDDILIVDLNVICIYLFFDKFILIYLFYIVFLCFSGILNEICILFYQKYDDATATSQRYYNKILFTSSIIIIHIMIVETIIIIL